MSSVLLQAGLGIDVFEAEIEPVKQAFEFVDYVRVNEQGWFGVLCTEHFNEAGIATHHLYLWLPASQRLGQYLDSL